MHPKTRVQQRQHRTRERIFRAAMELFLEKGFDHTTVAEISERADIGKGTFFTYFPTKEAVLGWIGERVVEEMQQALEGEEASQRSARTRIEAFLMAGAAWNEASPSLARLVFLGATRSLAQVDADAGNQGLMLEALVRLVQEGIERGELHPSLDPFAAGTLLFSTYFTAMMLWQRAGAEGPVRPLLKTLLDHLFQGLACPDASPSSRGEPPSPGPARE